MPTDSPEDVAHDRGAHGARCRTALASYRESLRHAAGRGHGRRRRGRSRKVAEQCTTWAGLGDEPAFFASFASSADGRRRRCAADLDAAAAAAGQAYADLAAFLRDELLPQGAGRRTRSARTSTRLWSRMYLGARLDLQRGLRVGLGGVHPHRDGDEGGRRPDPGRARASARRATRSTPTRATGSPGPRRVPRVDAGPVRPGAGGPARRALRDPGRDHAAGLQDRPARRRVGRVLHGPVGRLHAARARCGGRCRRTRTSSPRGAR